MYSSHIRLCSAIYAQKQNLQHHFKNVLDHAFKDINNAYNKIIEGWKSNTTNKYKKFINETKSLVKKNKADMELVNCCKEKLSNIRGEFKRDMEILKNTETSRLQQLSDACYRTSELYTQTVERHESDLYQPINKGNDTYIYGLVKEGRINMRINEPSYIAPLKVENLPEDKIEGFDLAPNDKINEIDMAMKQNDSKFNDQIIQYSIDKKSYSKDDFEINNNTIQKDYPINDMNNQRLKSKTTDDNVIKLIRNKIGFATTNETINPGCNFDFDIQKLNDKFEKIIYLDHFSSRKFHESTSILAYTIGLVNTFQYNDRSMIAKQLEWLKHFEPLLLKMFPKCAVLTKIAQKFENYIQNTDTATFDASSLIVSFSDDNNKVILENLSLFDSNNKVKNFSKLIILIINLIKLNVLKCKNKLSWNKIEGYKMACYFVAYILSNAYLVCSYNEEAGGKYLLKKDDQRLYNSLITLINHIENLNVLPKGQKFDTTILTESVEFAFDLYNGQVEYLAHPFSMILLENTSNYIIHNIFFIKYDLLLINVDLIKNIFSAHDKCIEGNEPVFFIIFTKVLYNSSGDNFTIPFSMHQYDRLLEFLLEYFIKANNIYKEYQVSEISKELSIVAKNITDCWDLENYNIYQSFVHKLMYYFIYKLSIEGERECIEEEFYSFIHRAGKYTFFGLVGKSNVFASIYDHIGYYADNHVALTETLAAYFQKFAVEQTPKLTNIASRLKKLSRTQAMNPESNRVIQNLYGTSFIIKNSKNTIKQNINQRFLEGLLDDLLNLFRRVDELDVRHIQQLPLLANSIFKLEKVFSKYDVIL